MKFRNVSPLGDLHLPAVGREIAHGEEFEATGDVAEALLKQGEHFERTDQPETKKTTKPKTAKDGE